MVSDQGMARFPSLKRRVAVIGAGVSGLAAAKCLLDEGLEPVVYEQSPQIGGLWNYDEALPDGGGVLYRALRSNTSKQTLAFSDFPLPETAPRWFLGPFSAAHYRLDEPREKPKSMMHGGGTWEQTAGQVRDSGMSRWRR